MMITKLPVISGLAMKWILCSTELLSTIKMNLYRADKTYLVHVVSFTRHKSSQQKYEQSKIPK